MVLIYMGGTDGRIEEGADAHKKLARSISLDNSDRRARFEIGAHVRVIAPVFQHEGRIGIITKRYLFSEDDPYGLYTHRYVVSFPELGTEAVFFASELAPSS